MIGDIYFLFAPVADFEPVERRWAEIWWPVRLNGSYYICVHGSRLVLPAHFTPSNLPTVQDLLEALRKRPDRFWMAKGTATLERAEVTKVKTRWAKIGNGNEYLSQVGYYNEVLEFENLRDVSLAQLSMRLEQAGTLRYQPVVKGNIRGTLQPLWN
jgi:hypothetical protein